MSVIKFEPRSRYSNPWAFKERSRYSPPRLHRRARGPGLSRDRIFKYSIMLGVFAVLFVASFLQRSIDTNAPVSTNAPTPMSAASITVVDGDTIRTNGQSYRLVGFDTPESGPRARCGRERSLAEAATNRLRQLVADGETSLEPVHCSCRPGTEGTPECNYGRHCAVLRAGGRDVGTILVSEGLARTYLCGQRGCPKRQSWCS